MNIFNVGLRRSGNTILRKILEIDERFDCYSEPLRVGEGKNTKELMKLRQIRRKFLNSVNQPNTPHQSVSFGAPKNPKQEVLSPLPKLQRKYIDYLTQQSEHTLIKFVRIAFNVAKLPATDDTRLIHVIRDPRRYVASHIGGKQGYGKNINQFFGEPRANFWNQENFIKFIINNSEQYAEYTKAPTYIRLLLMWKLANDAIENDGLKTFGDNYIKIKHENLCSDPSNTIKRIYGSLGMECPAGVINWAEANVQKPRKIIFEDNKHWRKAYKQLGIKYK